MIGLDPFVEKCGDYTVPRRKEIKGIAAGFVSHFISRNNDINGYWAMGILYKHALNNLSTSLEIDVLTHVISPGNQAFTGAVEQWDQWNMKKFRGLNIPMNWVSSVTVTINFEKTPISEDAVQQAADNYLGAPFTCLVSIVDDMGKSRNVMRRGRCRPHDPSREYRSTRVSS